MAWSFVGAGAVGTRANAIAVLPTGHAAGDLLVLIGSSNTVFTTPAGWTVGVLNVDGNPSVNTNLCLWYKIDSGLEVNVASGNSGNNTVFAMMAYRGIAASPLDIAGSGDFSGSTVISIATSSITTTKTNDLVISLFAQRRVSSATTGIWTEPNSTTARITKGTTNLTNGLLSVDENAASAGATTERMASSSFQQYMASFAIAFSEPSTSGTFDIFSTYSLFYSCN
jgi:hypothetical protein